LTQNVSYIFDIVARQVFEKGNHCQQFYVEMVFEPRGDGDGVFGMPLITLGIVIDDDAFLEISP
jgi:hypothetical protein